VHPASEDVQGTHAGPEIAVVDVTSEVNAALVDETVVDEAASVVVALVDDTVVDEAGSVVVALVEETVVDGAGSVEAAVVNISPHLQNPMGQTELFTPSVHRPSHHS
jgi:hypothetical protein